MAKDWQGPKTSRRDFLGLLSTALGGVALTRGAVLAQGGGGGFGLGPGGAPPLPNGYRFYNVLTPGVAELGLPLSAISGAVMMNDHSEIIFHAENTSGGFGVYELAMDYGGTAPAVAGARAVMQQGDTLPGGLTVDSIRRGTTNASGNFAAVVQTGDTPSVVLQREKTPFEPVIEFLDPAPNGTGLYGGAIGDIDLHDDDDLLVVSHFVDEEDDAEIGLFHLPGAVDSDQGALVMQSGDLIPGTETPIVNFGLVDIDDDGDYIAQLEGFIPRKKRFRPGTGSAASTASASNSGERSGVSAVVHGNVYAPAARAGIASASRRMVEANAPARGECIYGPRVSDDDVACTIHRRDTVQVLTLNGDVITRSDRHSPLGARIRGVSAPVLSPDGIVFYVLITKLGLELCMSNGLEERTILARGDLVEGLAVNAIFHAFHSQQADAAGRIVFTVEYENGQTSIVVGVPV